MIIVYSHLLYSYSSILFMTPWKYHCSRNQRIYFLFKYLKSANQWSLELFYTGIIFCENSCNPSRLRKPFVFKCFRDSQNSIPETIVYHQNQIRFHGNHEILLHFIGKTSTFRARSSERGKPLFLQYICDRTWNPRNQWFLGN